MLLRKIAGRTMRKVGEYGFHPYIKNHKISDVKYKFFYGTKQSSRWYDPLHFLACLEYEWVIQNVNLNKQIILDGGCHHGNYSVIFGVSSTTSDIVSVDPIDLNLALTEVNLRLNLLEPKLVKCVIANNTGLINFENVSNGRILDKGGIKIIAKKLSDIEPTATIVKLDIEGGEFQVLPSQIDEMPLVKTWIVEVHKRHGNPENLVNLFYTKGYEIDWVNPDKGVVEKYKMGANWSGFHSTIFARK